MLSPRQALIQMAHLPYLIEYWPALLADRRAREQAVVRPSLILEPFFFSGFEPDRSRARERTMQLLNTSRSRTPSISVSCTLPSLVTGKPVARR